MIEYKKEILFKLLHELTFIECKNKELLTNDTIFTYQDIILSYQNVLTDRDYRKTRNVLNKYGFIDKMDFDKLFY